MKITSETWIKRNPEN